jgi:hypothetical protein
MAAVASLKNLAVLGLDYTSVDDKGLDLLKTLPKLQELRLDSANITDAGVPAFQAMSSLKVLNLYHTLITEKGYEQIRAAMPDCKIIFDRNSSMATRRSPEK